MKIVDQSVRPEETIFYIACCVLEVAKRKRYNDVEVLRVEINEKFDLDVSYSTLALALDFLFLVEKISIKNKQIVCI